MPQKPSRVDCEWVALNAFRELVRVASRGDYTKSNYNNALDLGGVMYPELLGREVSVLQRARESEFAGEYRQKAEVLSVREKRTITPLELVRADVKEYKELLHIAEQTERDRSKVDKLKRKLGYMVAAEEELDPQSHSENQLIFRDAYNVQRELPALRTGHGFRDFKLPDERILRLRVLHPDKPEHVTGADLIYERHEPNRKAASIVAVQYKVWDDRVLYLSEPRMIDQIQKMAKFLCSKGFCSPPQGGENYRFPHCSAFLRPTDRLQAADQKFISTGEHLPICKIADCANKGPRGADVLEYGHLKDTSLAGDMFEVMFNRGKIGSRPIEYEDLERLYLDHCVESAKNNVVIYAQES